ncbi:MAG: Rsd/AlgQ family anti-sigma factor [Pseudomonadota bacterium]
MLNEEIIQELVDERQKLLVTFCRLTGLEPFVLDKPTTRLLGDFCQILVDYAGLAHFEVYEKFAGGPLAAAMPTERAKAIYDPLLETTDAIVDFNDAYDTRRPGFTLKRLPDDLSRLGEILASRFELEDELIRLLREMHGST